MQAYSNDKFPEVTSGSKVTCIDITCMDTAQPPFHEGAAVLQSRQQRRGVLVSPQP